MGRAKGQPATIAADAFSDLLGTRRGTGQPREPEQPPAHPTSEQIREARGWLSDCEWGDLDPEDIDELTPAQVFRVVQRHYDGGWAQFLIDAEPAF